MVDELDKAFENYKLGFEHAKACDSLPQTTVHTSFLVKGKVFDMTQTNSSSEANAIKLQIDRLRSRGVYETVKDTPEMKAILAEYEPLAGNKKDYS